MYEYAVKLKREGRGYVVVLPAFQVYTQGEDVADALGNARDALDEAIAGCIDDRRPIPASDARGAKYVVEVSPYLTLKAALYEAIREVGTSRSRLARQLDLGENELRRMLDPRHPTKFQRLVEALEALGVRVRVSVDRDDQRAA